MKPVELSIVIPAYNEAKRIGKTIDQILVFLKDQPYQAEIIVSDDGSKDETREIARQKLKGSLHKILESTTNLGKGHAVKIGMLSAQGKFLLFSDADLSTPIEEVNPFMRSLRDGYDCVIGSRALDRSRIKIRQNLIREHMGKTFNRLARMFSFKNIRDSQCGFKCFRREVAIDLFSRQKLEGFSFDAEVLYLAQRRGYKILESPVVWRNDPQSKVRMFRDSLKMFQDIMRIRWIHRNER